MFDDKELLNPVLKERLESSASMTLSLMRSTESNWDWQPVTRGRVLENAQTWTTAWAFDSRNAAALIGALLFDGLLALAYVGAVDAFESKERGGRDGC